MARSCGNGVWNEITNESVDELFKFVSYDKGPMTVYQKRNV